MIWSGLGSALGLVEQLEFFDAHFHLWDTSADSTSGREPVDLAVTSLAGPEKADHRLMKSLKAYVPGFLDRHTCDNCGWYPLEAPTVIYRCSDRDFDLCQACFRPAISTYSRRAYLAEFEGRLPSRLRHAGGVFVESLSILASSEDAAEASGVGGGRAAAPAASSREACLAELRFADRELSGGDFVLVPACALEQKSVAEVLAELAANPRVRGVRQALNCEEAGGDLLDSESWQAGFSLLGKMGLSFDLQLQPCQLLKAGAVLERHPDVVVVINHMGSPTLEDLTEGRLQYWQGIEYLASLPNTYMKLSFVCRCDREFDKNHLVVEAVHRIIRFFTPRRCMFASNYATDARAALGRWTADRLFSEYLAIAAVYSQEDQRQLFSGTARRAYRA